MDTTWLEWPFPAYSSLSFPFASFFVPVEITSIRIRIAIRFITSQQWLESFIPHSICQRDSVVFSWCSSRPMTRSLWNWSISITKFNRSYRCPTVTNSSFVYWLVDDSDCTPRVWSAFLLRTSMKIDTPPILLVRATIKTVLRKARNNIHVTIVTIRTRRFLRRDSS